MNLINRFKRSRRIHRAIRELTELNDDTLKDIGIERGNIANMVTQMIDGEVDQPIKATGENMRNFHVTSGATA